MSSLVSCQMYSLLDTWQNFEIALELWSCAISNFTRFLFLSKCKGQKTKGDLIFHMYLTFEKLNLATESLIVFGSENIPYHLKGLSLTVSETTNFRLLQIKRVCRRPF